jgi:hypothetical protein
MDGVLKEEEAMVGKMMVVVVVNSAHGVQFFQCLPLPPSSFRICHNAFCIEISKILSNII